MKNIDFAKYSRFFAFGCSFTNYNWLTWANILAKEMPQHHIYAQPGAGNFFIFQSLMEAVIQHDINQNDLVMIMFSNITREDRFVKHKGWITPGNLYHQNEYDEQFLKKYLCHHGYLMRDLNLLAGCKLALEKIGCDYELMSMVPFDSESSDGKKIDGVEYILHFYADILADLKPSVLDVVFNNDWESRPIRPCYNVPWQKEKYRDNHPTPLEHLLYLKSIYADLKLSQTTVECVMEMEQQVLSSNYQKDIDFLGNNRHRLGVDRDYE